MLELFLLLSALSVFTLAIAVLYTRRIQEARSKYDEAKDVVDDIILSFNRQLRRLEEQAEIAARKLSALSRQEESFAERLEVQKQEIQTLSKNLEPYSSFQKSLIKINSLKNQIGDFLTIKEELHKRLTKIENQKLYQKEPETRIATAIPIKREKALAPLTETELVVLELISAEGEKTAPEIQNHVKLSREHTARLMKKLYERGYLERSANKIPFKYHLKEEMQKILKRTEQKS